jgi:predicted porin
MFDDRSRTLIYVSPRAGGWLSGVSYASQADGEAAQALLQAGVVHETYRQQNVLRIGGSWAHLRSHGESGLDSYSVGASYNWDEVWLLGASATWNPNDSRQPLPGWRSDAVGWTTSLNYNRGPWTAGAFVQYARGREAAASPRDRLRAVEGGVSYRTSTRLRVFASWYRYLLDIGSNDRFTADHLVVVGLRMTL